MSGERIPADREVRDLAWSVDPALFVAILPIAAFGYANLFGDLAMLTYVHIGTGTLWTGVVLCIGYILSPILEDRDPFDRCVILARLVPLTVVVLPALAVVTIGSGVQLALVHDSISVSSPVILAVITVTALIAVVAFGLVFPYDIRLYRELQSETPDTESVASLGTRNAKLLTVQGAFQVAILFLMLQLSGQVPQ